MRPLIADSRARRKHCIGVRRAIEVIEKGAGLHQEIKSKVEGECIDILKQDVWSAEEEGNDPGGQCDLRIA